MLEALCLLCGSRKETVESTCVECGHSLREDEMELAHLFSSAHLSPDELEEASVRIASGERPAPKSRPQKPGIERGLSRAEMLQVVAGSFFLTPLFGLTLSWGWRSTRARAASQCLGLTLGIAVVLASLWGFFYLRL